MYCLLHEILQGIDLVQNLLIVQNVVQLLEFVDEILHHDGIPIGEMESNPLLKFSLVSSDGLERGIHLRKQCSWLLWFSLHKLFYDTLGTVVQWIKIDQFLFLRQLLEVLQHIYKVVIRLFSSVQLVNDIFKLVLQFRSFVFVKPVDNN